MLYDAVEFGASVIVLCFRISHWFFMECLMILDCEVHDYY